MSEAGVDTRRRYAGRTFKFHYIVKKVLGILKDRIFHYMLFNMQSDRF